MCSTAPVHNGDLSDKCYIIGYSLPNDDLEVIHLLRRGLEHLAPEHITVVAHSGDDSIWRRYRSLFGPQIHFETDGFEVWSEGIVSMRGQA